ncbi:MULTISPECIES: carbon-nitrogen hydrolase [Calditerrivibrio]|jgi:N-carbamoylputrescine amidase|uniref:Acyltransferase n=1 Tax=Calditerrivibrio nitroreducens TaxID=477976 RepID=A0A2J6WHU0_9BACT|nr:MAG: acyltransferase [Calditerrivibrio nitroreducens]
MGRVVRVGFVQQSNGEDVKANIGKLTDNINFLVKKGAELIVLPELHNTLYFCQKESVEYFDLAEPIPGPSTDHFSKLAKDNKVVLVTSIFEKRMAGVYHNTAVVFEKDGSIAGIYRKMHIPDDPGFYEKFYFTPGDIGFKPIDTSIGRIGVLVCWDQWYPEAARLMALAGAEIIVYPTAIGWDPDDTDDEKERQLNAWIISQRGHAVANGVFVVSVNRVGYEKDPSDKSAGITFWGNSFIAGPQGEIICSSGNFDEENCYADIALTRIEKVRRIWPFFRDRRIDAYGDILKRVID